MQIPNPNALLGNTALFSLNIQGISGLSRVVRFSGHEGISALFEFHLELAGADIDLRQIIGKEATLTIEGIEVPRFVHGIISHVQYSGHSRRHTLYELTLVPPLWRLLHRTNCRVFQPADTQAILTKVFKDAGLKKENIRFDLSASYGERNYCVQYRESDFAFISRLLEEDGIFYFFEHDAEKTTLVLADHAGAHKPIPGVSVVWFNAGSEVREREHIDHMRFAETIRPGKISLRDFNFKKPDDTLDVNADAERDVDLEIYDYPGEYQEPSEGAPHMGGSMAKIRLESLQAAKRQGSGGSDCPRLTPGCTFTLQGHLKRPDLNRGYLLTRVVHHGSQPQVLDEDSQGGFHYSNDFVCIEDNVPFRPPRMTPRPIVRGVQSATVVGPDSEEIHTDDQGRVKVQFHWDREGEFNHDSSCWVRVSQLWAGNGWGSMFIPRIGHEVLVDFIEGDPDRPIITGRVYHGNNDLPYPLPDEKTKTTIKSDSSIGGGGFNELRFEDRKGSEEIFLHAQKDWNTVILNNLTEKVSSRRSSSIGSSETISVGSTRTLSVSESDTTTVGTDRSATVGANETISIAETRSVSVGSTDSTTIGAEHSATISQAASPPPNIAATGYRMSDQNYSVTTGEATIILQGPNVSIQAKGAISLSGASISITATAGGDVVIQGGPMVHINPPAPAK
ncbi:MAG TPA: type VI secretion system tip protein VgrG [Nannocystis exedens]|nr:type VI secretion system tip protein VgrG [Nannocystis exedens]